MSTKQQDDLVTYVRVNGVLTYLPLRKQDEDLVTYVWRDGAYGTNGRAS